jgi:hypothetical protein
MLKFPHARLLIHNLIAERKLSGEDAIAAGACELGLMSRTEFEAVRGQSAAQCESCACSQTAKLILKKHFDKHKPSENNAFEKSWQNMQERSNRRLSAGLATTPPGESCTLCSQHAPIIFDYLLQEVHSHT